jgi:photosystem II stability/assembly factor-like uncharacterized protein
MRKIHLVILCALTLTASKSAFGQWQVVAANAMTQNSYYGAIHFRDGIVWAGGVGQLIYSLDSGRTWVPTNWADSGIRDIAFFDKDTGIVAYYNAIKKTTDRGQSWKTVWNTYSCYRVSYGVNAFEVHLQDAQGILNSTDGGNSFVASNLVGSTSLTKSKDGTLYATRVTGTIANSCKSTDRGITWSIGGELGYDNFSMDIDSCDSKVLYVANEEWFVQKQKESHLYVSKDAGTSWTATSHYPIPFFSGCFASSTHAQYAGTVANGVFRSSDHGQTWTTIGGPNSAIDSRNLCAISDNLIIAVDTFGNVWKTTNSGGDSLRFASPSLPVKVLFPFAVIEGGSNDTVSIPIDIGPIYKSSKITFRTGAKQAITILLDTTFLLPIRFSSTLASGSIIEVTRDKAILEVAFDNDVSLIGDTIIGYLHCILNLNGTSMTDAILSNCSLTIPDACELSSEVVPEDGSRILLMSSSNEVALTTNRSVLKLWPNPTSSIFTISEDLALPTLSLDAIDVFGKHYRLQTLGGSSFDVSLLPSGVYYILNGKYVAKFVKE